MMQALHKAIALNNEATAMLLKSPDHEEVAVGTLTESLKQLKKILVSLPPPPPSQVSKAHQAALESYFHSSEDLPTLPVRSSFVYNKIFHVVSLEAAASTNLGQDTIQAYIALVIFNLALIHHRRGILHSTKECIAKSERLYKVCIRLLDALPTSHGTTLVLKLATLNNLSQIAVAMGNLQEAGHHLQTLSYLLSYDNECVLDMFTSQEWEGLLENVMMLNPPTIAPAA